MNRSRNIRVTRGDRRRRCRCRLRHRHLQRERPRSGCAGEGEDPPRGIALPSLIQPPSPAPAPHRDSQALVALGDYTTAFRTRCSSDGGANTPLSMVSLSTVAAPTTSPAATQAPVQNFGAEFADPFHHVTTLTPPVVLPPGSLQTPDAALVVYPVSTLQKKLCWPCELGQKKDVIRVASIDTR